MTTLSEVMARLSPERRQRVEARANALIAEERARRARRARSLLKGLQSVEKGRRRFVLASNYPHVRNAGVNGVGKRGYIQVRRVGRGRLQVAGHRRHLSVLR